MPAFRACGECPRSWTNGGPLDPLQAPYGACHFSSVCLSFLVLLGARRTWRSFSRATIRARPARARSLPSPGRRHMRSAVVLKARPDWRGDRPDPVPGQSRASARSPGEGPGGSDSMCPSDGLLASKHPRLPRPPFCLLLPRRASMGDDCARPGPHGSSGRRARGLRRESDGGRSSGGRRGRGLPGSHDFRPGSASRRGRGWGSETQEAG